jgi:hypothetical protein
MARKPVAVVSVIGWFFMRWLGGACHESWRLGGSERQMRSAGSARLMSIDIERLRSRRNIAVDS